MALDFVDDLFKYVEETPLEKWENFLNIFGHRMNFLTDFLLGQTSISLGPLSVCYAPSMSLFFLRCLVHDELPWKEHGPGNQEPEL